MIRILSENQTFNSRFSHVLGMFLYFFLSSDVLKYPSIYEFMLGSNSLEEISENSQKIPCSGVYVHPMYNENDNSSYDYDIALMKMEREYEITDHVRTVCVPQKSQEDEGFAAGKPVTITGWGTTYEGGKLHDMNLTRIFCIK